MPMRWCVLWSCAREPFLHSSGRVEVLCPASAILRQGDAVEVATDSLAGIGVDRRAQGRVDDLSNWGAGFRIREILGS